MITALNGVRSKNLEGGRLSFQDDVLRCRYIRGVNFENERTGNSSTRSKTSGQFVRMFAEPFRLVRKVLRNVLWFGYQECESAVEYAGAFRLPEMWRCDHHHHHQKNMCSIFWASFVLNNSSPGSYAGSNMRFSTMMRVCKFVHKYQIFLSGFNRNRYVSGTDIKT